MARRKETIWQQDFGLGSVRPEAIERDDVDIVGMSLKECSNTVALTTGQCEQRPGTVHLGTTSADNAFEVALGGGAIYDLLISSDGLVMYDENENVVHTVSSFDWTAISGGYGSPSYSDIRFWVIADPEASEIIIGSRYFPPRSLLYDGSSWSFGAFTFGQTAVGAQNIPFWRHYPSVSIQPSALTGSITITASSGIFADAHENIYIRYSGRQIQLGTRVSATVMNATVIEELAPTLDIVVASASGFQEGDAVEDASTGGQGVISGISGTTITVLVTSGYTSFTATNDLVGPNAKSNMSSVGAAGSPASTLLWDMQLWNNIHGYPGTAALHGGRMYFADYPSLPRAFSASSVGLISDHSTGTSDASGFADALSSGDGGEIKHILSAEDLLFFTTRGLFYQLTRDGSAVTPLSIRPVRFSRMGCSEVAPVAVDDGAVFVDATGNQVYGAALAGDVYKSWRVVPLSALAPHIINSPVHLGATATGSQTPETFVFATLASGDVAVGQWRRDEGQALVSWRPWTTEGTFKRVYQAFGKVHCLVTRTINGATSGHRERFEEDAVMDCVAGLQVNDANPTGLAGVAYLGTTTKLATHLNGHTAAVSFSTFDMGDHVIQSGRPKDDDGNDIDYPAGVDDFVQIGLLFTTRVVPWPRRSVRTQSGIREIKRVVEFYVTVQDTSVFEVGGRPYGGYYVGEDLTQPPPLRDMQVRKVLLGTDDFEVTDITRSRPGKFRLLKIGQKVTV